jgi:hypothetical protein
MSRSKLCVLFVASALVAVASPAVAQQVTVGTNSVANGFPFTVPYSGIYQQVYGASSFSGPISINTVSFFPQEGQVLAPNSNSYTLSFYLTNSAVDALSTDPAANETTLLSNFGTFVPGNSYTFTGNAFTYDPTLGNLLMLVSTNSSASSGGLQASFSTTDTISRLFELNGTGPLTTDSEGLVTQFSLTSAMPEPGTWAMMLIGFGAVGFTMRRRNAGLAQLA